MGETAKGEGSKESFHVSFQLAAYDKTQPLIIDPVLSYSTYLGGSASDAPIGSTSIAVDDLGNAYIAGSTVSLDFPTTSGAFDTTHNPFGGNAGYSDAFVVKVNATGSELIYATYLGGSIQANSFGTDIAVDGQGNVYVVGFTGQGVFNIDFPTTPGAFDTTFNGGGDGFVTKLDSTGSSLVYSTFLGGSGSDNPEAIALDSQENAYVTGVTNSGNFPTTPDTFDTTTSGASEAFVVKLNAIGTVLIYSTYLGGMNSDLGLDIAVDGAGNGYVAGRTDSPDFPTTPGAYDTSFNQVHGGFITKLNATGTALVYSTFLSGNSRNNELRGIALDGAGNAYVVGETSQADFPTTTGAFDTVLNLDGSSSVSDATVTKLDTSGSALIYSTYIGGSLAENGFGIAVDSSTNASVTGFTCSTDFPTQNPIQAARAGGCDAFVTKLNRTGAALVYSTYLGGAGGGSRARGIAVDTSAHVYVAGDTSANDFPVTPDAFMVNYNGGGADAFVAKISDAAPPPLQPVLSVTPDALDFGTVAVGSSTELEFTVTNTGEGTLTGTASTSAPFSIVSGGSYSLGAETSQTVVVRFAPTAAGSFAGNVNFESNAGNASQVVTGTTSSLSISQLSIFPVGGSPGDPIVQGVANSTQAVIANTSDATIPAGTPVSVGLFALDNESRVLQPTAFQTTLPELLPSKSVTISNAFKILSTKTTDVTLLVTNDSIGTTARTTPMFVDRDVTEERHCLLEITALVTGALCASTLNPAACIAARTATVTKMIVEGKTFEITEAITSPEPDFAAAGEEGSKLLLDMVTVALDIEDEAGLSFGFGLVGDFIEAINNDNCLSGLLPEQFKLYTKGLLTGLSTQAVEFGRKLLSIQVDSPADLFVTDGSGNVSSVRA